LWQFVFLKKRPDSGLICDHVWTRQGWQGTGQGRRQAPPQGTARQHPGHHQACHPPPRAPRRCEAHLRAHLRGDPLGPESLPRERDPRCGDLHRARPPQDRDGDGRSLRPQAPGPHPLRLRRLSSGSTAFTGQSRTRAQPRQTQGFPPGLPAHRPERAGSASRV